MKHGDMVFPTSFLLVLAFVFIGMFAPAELDKFSRGLHSWIIEHFGWAYLLAAFGFVIFSVVLAFSRYGRVKLGQDHEKPQYSYFSWFSML
ncbi:MAG TPA: glycine/betaine ABC transporter permease, partial [Sediminispirochaeta sp.]|nr:glycine/betaine ABC transporter permease [Sediminispirochaeta sp.]